MFYTLLKSGSRMTAVMVDIISMIVYKYELLVCCREVKNGRNRGKNSCPGGQDQGTENCKSCQGCYPTRGDLIFAIPNIFSPKSSQVATLLALKAEYKAATGEDWKPPAAPAKAAPAKAPPAKASTPPKVIYVSYVEFSRITTSIGSNGNGLVEFRMRIFLG